MLVIIRVDMNDQIEQFFQTQQEGLIGALEDAGLSLPDATSIRSELKQTLLASNYADQQFRGKPQLLMDLIQQSDLHRTYENNELSSRLLHQLTDCQDVDDLSRRLRTFRHYEVLRIIWRDVNGLATLSEIMLDMSNLADACITQAAEHLQAWLEKTAGTPCDQHGNREKLQIIAMGKLGAKELNLSSDVDLIFCYPEEGQIEGERTISKQQFFTRLAQQLIRVLHQVMADGFVFRVDARLRPYGESGALALSFDAMHSYYQQEARNWERYAMVKARMIYGDDQANRRLLIMLRHFTYRIYLDFAAMQSLRRLKEKIRKQVRAKNMENNIKLGAGGIREIEFIAQVFQLIHGGHDYALQTPCLFSALKILGRREYLHQVPELIEAYTFLRTLEHRLQAMDNRQTHVLPTDEFVKSRIAVTMGFDNWASLLKKLNEYRDFIISQFEQVFEKPIKKTLIAEEGERGDEEIKQKVESIFSEWDKRFDQAELSNLASQRLQRFLKVLRQAIWQHSDPVLALDRVLQVTDSLLRHSAYLILFEETPEALAVLIKLCGASPWITHQIARYPVLLAELLNERRLYLSADLDQLEELLAEQMSYVDYNDAEAVLDVLRRFKRRQVLHVAASDVMGKLPVMRVSDNLTEIAVAILRAALKAAWQENLVKYGFPLRKNGKRCRLDFIIIAYGKLGGTELGYGSDLDLVFVHDADDQAMTDAKPHQKSITGSQFYARLAKKIIHILNTQMFSGNLYNVDTRLKPGGTQGLLSPNFSAFKDYQKNEAWTWEHQALVRARVVAGSQSLTEKFNRFREKVLLQQPDEQTLKKSIVEMREKMRQESKSSPDGMFNLKNGQGGMTDIEFLAQYVVLAWAYKVPELLIFRDNIRIFETCESSGLLPQQDVDLLCHAYLTYRRQRHYLILQNLPDDIPETDLFDLREKVAAIWKKLLG
ncbi:MAG: bifunctional [glutamate--ammonia ligase]-adenylyl-L-tyrosine phosphorylase/[glutamate--ammonia-ligase] adenylyltransferase [Legionellaceae bacterium]|nr:bifunctional [glutamate--ammonia ligase]-adenylyl-L-tyrosine phosphorylase/[glutamate--ammonia-ligase] adenylyltransferase [Legionellaceae bacterium]